ncbi:MAG: ATP-dependent DNA helicase RecG [Clostridiales bacterium]|nr:ATP-dependent DNA helicase RecG [Clostridiales bacterium]
MINLESNIQYVKGVGDKRAQQFAKLGIYTVKDLLCFYPRNYQNWAGAMTVQCAPDGEKAAVRAKLVSTVAEHRVRRNMTLYKCDFSDGQCIIHVTLFNNKYLAGSLQLGREYILFGKIEKTLTGASMSAPELENAQSGAGIHPIYRASGTLNSKAIARVVKNALDDLPAFEETLPGSVLNQYNLAPLDFAVRQVHFPTDFGSLEKARHRLIFEELLVLLLGLLTLRGKKKSDAAPRVKTDYSAEFLKLLPFEMTSAQKRAVAQCVADISCRFPMNRLLQGDVGSGKTAVAAAVIYSVAKNGFQSALMAPTELLARQHYETFQRFFAGTGITVCLLTGSTPAKEKREAKDKLMHGEISLAIGTHALIQNDVEFKNLALVITDEQHRFGVKQRANLAEKGTDVHTLVMSATPIPRTLGLIIYGDLDISVLDEYPPGRREIRTDVVNSSYHKRIYKFIRAAVERGEQAYIVCPLVDEGQGELHSANEYAAALAAGGLRGINIGLLHGKMKPKDKEKTMRAFAQGDIKVLVSTTVIEVGIDVRNATVMLIENAERFGLSQLHQLRGRVGRGDRASYCILVSDSKSAAAAERLGVMKKYSDGFKIADEDLKQRGPGDFFGSRQHGLPQLKIADMLSDIETLRLCRAAADEILKRDFALSLPQHRGLKAAVLNMFQNAVGN